MSKNRTSKFHQNVLYMLPVAVVPSCCDGSAIRYVLPVLWMRSFFHIIERIGRFRNDTCFVEFARWRLRGRNLLHLTMLVDFRWTQELNDFKEQRTRLLGDCLLGSAFMCYIGAFSWEFRHEMIYNMWCNDIVKRRIPISSKFRLETLLTDEVEISKYVVYGYFDSLAMAG